MIKIGTLQSKENALAKESLKCLKTKPGKVSPPYGWGWDSSHHSAQSPKSRWIFLDPKVAHPHPTLAGQTPQRHKPHSWAGESQLCTYLTCGDPQGLDLVSTSPSGQTSPAVAIISFQITKKDQPLGIPHSGGNATMHQEGKNSTPRFREGAGLLRQMKVSMNAFQMPWWGIPSDFNGLHRLRPFLPDVKNKKTSLLCS